MKKRITKTTTERILDSKLSKQFIENPNGYDLVLFETLEPEAAKVLSTFQGDLFLDGLTTLSAEVANMFIPHTGILSLKGLKRISLPVAKALVNRRS